MRILQITSIGLLSIVLLGFKVNESPSRFQVKHLEVNSNQADFGPTFYKNKIVFASSRKKTSVIKRIWSINNLPYLNLYEGELDEAGELSELKYFNKSFNKKYNEGPASFSADGTFMAYTKNHTNKKGAIKLKVVTREFVDGKWKDVVEFPFNNESYSVGHPAISPDGKVMYFSSDMPGGKGGADIYKSEKLADNTWTKPQNLGDKINTVSNEMFPFYHEGEMLFFASNGLGGSGGLDIFVAGIKDGNFSTPENLGTEINSSEDDFGLILSQNQSYGYFSSNRVGGEGDDDLYFFKNAKPFIFKRMLAGVIKDEQNSILSNVKVTLLDENGEPIKTIMSDNEGNYSFELEPETKYSVVTETPDFKNNKLIVEASSINPNSDIILAPKPEIGIEGKVLDLATNEPINNVEITIKNNINGELKTIKPDKNGEFNVPLENMKQGGKLDYTIKVMSQGYLSKTVDYRSVFSEDGNFVIAQDKLMLSKVKTGETKLEDLISINPIYFDLSKYNIRPDAAIELDKIVKVLNENPTMEIELGSHTDSRGSSSSNMRLSDLRAKSSANYVKQRITNPDRIKGRGYGETKLVNKCSNGVTCSKEEHQQNRRTEFIILKM